MNTSNVLTTKSVIPQMFSYADDDGFSSGGPSNATYLFAQALSNTAPLKVSSSTFYLQYTCQVPQRKDARSLFVAVLVADLIFLQTSWKLFRLAITAWVEHIDHEADYCKGCAGRIHGQNDQYALVENPSAAHSTTLSVDSDTSTDPMLGLRARRL